MAKKKALHKDDSGATVPRRRYDPATRPYPRSVNPSVDPGPIGNSRQQRRQRAKLSFVEQWTLAHSLGFPIPQLPLKKGRWTEQHWISEWELRYAQR